MKLRIVLVTMLGFVAALDLVYPAYGQQPPMIEKHIFSPDTEIPESPKKGESRKEMALEREISFTGIIISPQGKRAMIKERARVRLKGTEKQKSLLYKEGDEINGMTLKEIGTNYIVLLKDGKEVRLRLYRGDKKRPSPPREPALRKTPIRKVAPPKRVMQPPVTIKRHISRPILRKRHRPSIPRNRGLTLQSIQR